MAERRQPPAERFAALVPVAMRGAAGHTTRPPSVRRHAQYPAPARGLQPARPPCMAGRVTLTFIRKRALHPSQHTSQACPCAASRRLGGPAASLCQSLPVHAPPTSSPLLPDVTPTWRADGLRAGTPRTPPRPRPSGPLSRAGRVRVAVVRRWPRAAPRHATPPRIPSRRADVALPRARPHRIAIGVTSHCTGTVGSGSTVQCTVQHLAAAHVVISPSVHPCK